MKFCKKCKHTFEDSQEYCSNCKNRKPLEDITDQNTPVYLISADGFERERIQTALTSNGIPNDSIIKEEDTAPESIKGFSSSWRDILVPFSAYDKAYDICVGIGAIKPDGEVKVVGDDAQEEFEDMPPAKRTTVKILSAILFIIVAALIIFGTDAITGFIKGLFN
ncbi:MAG TPA: hypothetical protein DEO32_01360 [Ruminococcaceae bacterium]|nr:hypothetical protein [Oscillospiraceae bacterium]